MQRVYHSDFRSGVHIGRAGIGLEKTEITIPADTLFSAICQTWATFYSAQSLTQFLDRYRSDDPPFLLTSAFPFAEEIKFFPKPEKLKDLVKIKDDDLKKIKKVQFISEARFNQFINRDTIEFDENDLISGGKVWIDRSVENVKENLTIWKTDTRPRVTIDRNSSASEIWHVTNVQFNKDCGLWFSCRFADDEIKTKIETLLRVLGDSGIGGERIYGHGLFNLNESKKPFDFTDDRNAKMFITLSPVLPKDQLELAELMNGDVSYSISEKSGWSNRNERSPRKKIWMFGEGSILNRQTQQQIGGLVDLKQEWHPHPKWRYGYAWQIGIKGDQE